MLTAIIIYTQFLCLHYTTCSEGLCFYQRDDLLADKGGGLNVIELTAVSKELLLDLHIYFKIFYLNFHYDKIFK